MCREGESRAADWLIRLMRLCLFNISETWHDNDTSKASESRVFFHFPFSCHLYVPRRCRRRLSHTLDSRKTRIPHSTFFFMFSFATSNLIFFVPRRNMTLYRMTHFNQSWNHATGPTHGLVKCLLSMKWTLIQAVTPSGRYLFDSYTRWKILNLSLSSRKVNRNYHEQRLVSLLSHTQNFFLKNKQLGDISAICVFIFSIFSLLV